MNTQSKSLEWQCWSEALFLFLGGATLRSCIPIAIIVGTLLSTINQGDVILSGTINGVVCIKVVANYLIPFCVSSYGFLNGCRK